jgi:hypothetical protein
MNVEQVAYNNMLREIEGLSYGGDVQDDDVSDWTDVKTYLPEFSRMVWAAVPNVIICAHQTFLLYLDSDGQWRDNTGCLFGRRVNFWQYADVPECDISC